MKGTLLTFFSFFLFTFGNFAQTLLEEYTKAYPKENGVFLRKNETATISISKQGEPKIKILHDEERLFLNDNCKYYANGSVGFSSFTKLEDLEANVYVPNGEKFKKTRINQFDIEEEVDRNVFHDDFKQMSFIYVGLIPGGKTELKYEKELEDSHFFGSFYFSSYLPVKECIYTINTPLDLEIDYKLFGTNKDKVNYSTSVKGKVRTHTWTAKEMDASPFEDNAVNFRYFGTHLQVWIKSYKSSGETKYMYRNPADLYSYYRGFVKDVNIEAKDDLKIIADSITQGIESEEEKVKAIFYWVQDNIKYVAFEAGMGGFVPREAKLVCDRKYGDCKDMTSILYSMLTSQGIDAYYTWIGSRDIPYDYTEVPTVAVDNHMICAYNNGEKYIFLDATGKGINFGLPTPFIQGKQALIGKSTTEHEIVRVPIVASNVNTTIDTVYVSIKEDLVVGRGKVTYSGYSKMQLADYLSNISESEKEEFYVNGFKKGNNKCESKVTKERGLKKRDTPLEMEYVFEISDYLKSYEDELYYNPFLKKYFSSSNINLETNEVDHENRFQEMNNLVSYISIPKGYSVSYLPKNMEFSHSDFSASINFTTDEVTQTILLNINFDMSHIIFKAKDFSAWNEMIRQLNVAYSEVIVFKKNK
ncbi:MAG: DUF3857 domain-containing protein [Crocinitomicaceae bacterium]|nr:DUF3857 domain-containing protein [Crocinitomicaceae bacterium]